MNSAHTVLTRETRWRLSGNRREDSTWVRRCSHPPEPRSQGFVVGKLGRYADARPENGSDSRQWELNLPSRLLVVWQPGRIASIAKAFIE
jgi:hypothetical protein